MHSRRLKGHKGDLYDPASNAHQWALDQLRELLLQEGFVGDTLDGDARRLRVYPVKSGEFPLLSFGFVCDQKYDDEESVELLEILVLSKGSPRAIDARLREIIQDDRCIYAPTGMTGRTYRTHGHFILPLHFEGPLRACTFNFAALREPLHRIYRALAFGEFVKPQRAVSSLSREVAQNEPTPPIPNSYLVPGTRLFAGEYPGVRDERETRTRLAALLEAGVDVFIDLTCALDALEAYEPLLPQLQGGLWVERHRIPLDDHDLTDGGKVMHVLNIIDSALHVRNCVYVHCAGGLGRTGTIIGCWLVRHGRTGTEALALVGQLFQSLPEDKRRRHPDGSPESPLQRDLVLRWDEIEREAPLPEEMNAEDEEDDCDAGEVRTASPARPWEFDMTEESHEELGPDFRGRLRTVIEFQPSERDIDTTKGCLLGGAVGDALGAPVEFLSWQEIQQLFGADGIQELAPAYGRIGAVTDDTQMTLWTAEGVLRGLNRTPSEGIDGPIDVLPRSYLRWLYTQDGALPDHVENPDAVLGRTETPRGWLLAVKSLRARRAPGNTCLTALRSKPFRSGAGPVNDSKGCGSVMRVAPIALIPNCAPEAMLRLACVSAGITHGHPTGILAAGAFVLILASVRKGMTIDAAVAAAVKRIRREPGHEETTVALQQALTVGHSPQAGSVSVTESLGGGWTAESALAIGVYAALASGGEFDRGVRIAVNHSGDSDSTGSIAGQLLGVQLGVGSIPARWLEQLELRAEIEAIAEDLAVGVRSSDEWWARYPSF